MNFSLVHANPLFSSKSHPLLFFFIFLINFYWVSHFHATKKLDWSKKSRDLEVRFWELLLTAWFPSRTQTELITLIDNDPHHSWMLFGSTWFLFWIMTMLESKWKMFILILSLAQQSKINLFIYFFLFFILSYALPYFFNICMCHYF